MSWSWRDEEEYGGPLDKGLVDTGPSPADLVEEDPGPREPEPIKPHEFDSLFGEWSITCAVCTQGPWDEIHDI